MHAVARLVLAVALAAIGVLLFLVPGVTVARNLVDPALSHPGTPRVACRVHGALSARLPSWARARIASGRASSAALHDVPTTEWPIFTAVFYLMATESLQKSWEDGDRTSVESPASYAGPAVHAAKDLLLDPSHHTWVRTHWGEGYLHRENVFFRGLLIAGLTSYERLTHDGTALPVLRDQVETLVSDLDHSERGLLNDYPGECYPIDVVAAVGFVQRADAVLGTDHGAFFARERRAFTGDLADPLGLVPYRVSTATYEQEQPSRGVGNSWVALFAGDLWPASANDLYARYERAFWRDHGWAAGFREWAPGSPEPEWMTEVDAGPVIDGFGTAASAFGIAAARRNGRFDQARTLSSQMIALSWPLPGGMLLAPRSLSHATDAPYLGEAGLLYFLTVEPREGVPVVVGGHWPGLVYGALVLYFGLGGALLLVAVRLGRRCTPSPAGQNLPLARRSTPDGLSHQASEPAARGPYRGVQTAAVQLCAVLGAAGVSWHSVAVVQLSPLKCSRSMANVR